MNGGTVEGEFSKRNVHKLINKEITVGRKKRARLCKEEKTIRRKGRRGEKNMSQFAVR